MGQNKKSLQIEEGEGNKENMEGSLKKVKGLEMQEETTMIQVVAANLEWPQLYK